MDPTNAPQASSEALDNVLVVQPSKTPDLEEGTLGSLLAFFREQPTKYFRRFVFWYVGTVLVCIGFTFGVGMWVSNLLNANEITRLKSDANLLAQTSSIDWQKRLSDATLTASKEGNELRIANADLAAKLRVSEVLVASKQELLMLRDAEVSDALGQVKALQLQVASGAAKVRQAQNCAGIKAEFDKLTQNALVVQREYARLPLDAWTRKKEIEGELRILDARALILKSQLDACAAK